MFVLLRTISSGSGSSSMVSVMALHRARLAGL
jgi:hypothetical protein